MTWTDHLEFTLRALISKTQAAKGDFSIAPRVKQWLKALSRHFKEAELLFHEIKRLQSYEELIKRIESSRRLSSLDDRTALNNWHPTY